ncbi:MAG: superoxide dismutase [Ni] [Rickettsiales bacterium]|nr:superoxide dismutase [Ni] [Rickettsiales bacterium]
MVVHRKSTITIIGVLVWLMGANAALAHCEIPCGVYDDGARFVSIMGHANTIEKSMNEINRLSAQVKPDFHMISRWTANKEKLAQEVQEIASVYFLTQRVKAPKADASDQMKQAYAMHTGLLHQILVAAMKAKQSTDVKAVGILRDLTEEYKAHYFKKHGHNH